MNQVDTLLSCLRTTIKKGFFLRGKVYVYTNVHVYSTGLPEAKPTSVLPEVFTGRHACQGERTLFFLRVYVYF